MKAFITKYALTIGIFEIDAEICTKGENMIRDLNSIYTYYHNKEWRISKAEALEEAESMRRRKIETLKKQIIKLENMVFEVKTNRRSK